MSNYLINEKLNVLISERNNLRDETIMYQKSINNVILYFFTLVGVLSGIIFDKEVINNDSLKTVIILGISQLEFFLGLYIISLMAIVNAHSGYIKAIETKINNLLKDNISVWETEIVGEFIYNPKRSFFISLTFIILSFLIVFMLLIFSSGLIKSFSFMMYLTSLELIILITLTILMIFERDWISKKISKLNLNQ